MKKAFNEKKDLNNLGKNFELEIGISDGVPSNLHQDKSSTSTDVLPDDVLGRVKRNRRAKDIPYNQHKLWRYYA